MPRITSITTCCLAVALMLTCAALPCAGQADRMIYRVEPSPNGTVWALNMSSGVRDVASSDAPPLTPEEIRAKAFFDAVHPEIIKALRERGYQSVSSSAVPESYAYTFNNPVPDFLDALITKVRGDVARQLGVDQPNPGLTPKTLLDSLTSIPETETMIATMTDEVTAAGQGNANTAPQAVPQRFQVPAQPGRTVEVQMDLPPVPPETAPPVDPKGPVGGRPDRLHQEILGTD